MLDQVAHDVDDRSGGALAEVRQYRATGVVRGADRAVELRAIVVPLDLAEALPLLGIEDIRRERVVDQHIDAAEFVDDLLHHCHDVRGARDIGLQRQRVAARDAAFFSDLLGCRAIAPEIDRDRRLPHCPCVWPRR